MRASKVSKPIRRVQVIKRPGGRSPNWYLRYWETDPISGETKEKWRSTGTSVRKRADQQRRSLERHLESEATTAATTWSDFKRLYVDLQASKKPPKTVDSYRSSLEIFERVARPSTLQSITSSAIEDFADARLREDAAPATVNRDLRHLKAALRWASRRGLIESPPDFHGLFVRESRSRPTVITEQDFAALVRATQSDDANFKRRSGDWWRLFLYVAYYMGLRRGEVLALSWSDIRLEHRELRVRAASSKSRKERVLPMPAELVSLLKRWRTVSGSPRSSEPVLTWPHDTLGPFYDDWNELVRVAAVPSGKRYTPKDCRSSCASALIAAGVPTVVVKDYLGHASVVTTECYYVNTDDAMRPIAEARRVLSIDADASEDVADENM